ncbi:lipocalin family protein [Nocardia wallacei]|uniref:lipocalin family protein n=1 Tax=Nocardia wallacei TaxID=480035 RepID=UPI003CC8063B
MPVPARSRFRWISVATAPIGAVAVLFAAAPVAVAVPTPVPRLDLQRYLGTWHQLAAVPQYFTLVCARDTRAEYTLDPAGDVSVHNSCLTWAGTTNEITGTATVTDPVTDAQLHVAFPGVPAQEQRHGPPNYVVTGLASDYSWAVVTDPAAVSGFVLSRTPSLDAGQWQDVRDAIAAAGQDTCRYLTSPAAGGHTAIVPLCSI